MRLSGRSPAVLSITPPRRRDPGRRLWSCALAAALLFTGCPRRFDPRAEEIHSQNPEAEAEYQQAQQLLKKGDLAGADQALQQFLGKYAATPTEPLLPVATLQAAQVARSLGQPSRAKELAAPLVHPAAGAPTLSPWITDRARLELGLSQHRLGDFAEARALLAPLSSQIVDSAEATELHATLADLWLRESQTAEALRELELFYRGVSVRPVEQAYIRDQVNRLTERLPPEQQAKVRQRFGIEAQAAAAAGPDPASARAGSGPIVGLLIPLAGKERALGERVLRGALWAAEALGGPRAASLPTGIDLRVRDTATGDPTSLVAELKREGAQVVIGPPARGAETTQLLAAAEREGLLALDLSSRPTGSPPPPASARTTLHLVRGNVARAQALAQTLVNSGLPTVAILAPATAYGQAMTRAFVDAVAERSRGGGVQIVAQLTFPDNATTFTAQAKRLLETAPSALYVPASAAQLELLAAQLASSAVLPIYKVTRGTVDKPGLANPPVKLLLASAEGMGERLLKNAGRYLQGAVLAPLSIGRLTIADGPAAAAARWDGYTEQVGAEPGALDALGFDAVLSVRAACSRLRAQAPGARCTSEALAPTLRSLQSDGATGVIAFDDAGERSGPVFLVRVDGGMLRLAR